MQAERILRKIRCGTWQPSGAVTERLSRTRSPVLKGERNCREDSKVAQDIGGADPERQAMVIAAVRGIETGGQLTISYCHVAKGAPPRRKSWFERYQAEKPELDGSEVIA